jgi:hypothetical protein
MSRQIVLNLLLALLVLSGVAALGSDDEPSEPRRPNVWQGRAAAAYVEPVQILSDAVSFFPPSTPNNQQPRHSVGGQLCGLWLNQGDGCVDRTV